MSVYEALWFWKGEKPQKDQTKKESISGPEAIVTRLDAKIAELKAAHDEYYEIYESEDIPAKEKQQVRKLREKIALLEEIKGNH